MEKNFDCLKMKDEIQARVYEKTKDMAFPELNAYLNESLENDSLWQRLVRRDYVQKQQKVTHKPAYLFLPTKNANNPYNRIIGELPYRLWQQ
ncbi:hypothetical protein R83H12_00462 [Fibrobacteria bacterium R8-3-H12]